MSQTAVVGLGLIGGSLALAAGARGYDRDPDVRARARGLGIDAADSLEAAVADAEIVVTAVPTVLTPEVLRALSALAPDAVLTDTASQKRPIVEAMAALRPGTRCVAGHPMAGARRRGIEAAAPRSSAAARGCSCALRAAMRTPWPPSRGSSPRSARAPSSSTRSGTTA